ncbi:MAG TPA: hypothetical protein P5193_12565 [Microthrixaceae bacterium]|jgi:hypothetical protein|nr:hypothetical protein [Microthrixaceae bacterium]
MTRRTEERNDRRVLVALAACCVGPMLLLVVLTSVLSVAVGPAAAVTLGVVAAGLCVAVMAQRHRRHQP